MANNEAYILPNHSGPTMAVAIDPSLCIGCNSCADICRIQTILPNPEKGGVPVVAYPDECWYCGCCVEACPTGALEMRLPINQRVFFKDKETGEVFRIGSVEAPAKSFFRPPYGWLSGNESNGLFRAIEQGKRVAAFVTPEVCSQIGRWFGEQQNLCEGGEKLAAFLRAVGVQRVYRCEVLPEVLPDSTIIVFAGTVPDTRADYNFDDKTLSNFLHRACTSNFTAVHTWRTIQEELFDRLETEI